MWILTMTLPSQMSQALKLNGSTNPVNSIIHKEVTIIQHLMLKYTMIIIVLAHRFVAF